MDGKSSAARRGPGPALADEGRPGPPWMAGPRVADHGSAQWSDGAYTGVTLEPIEAASDSAEIGIMPSIRL